MNRKASFFSLLFLCFFTSTTAQIILLEGRVTNPDEVENIMYLIQHQDITLLLTKKGSLS